MAFCDWLPSLSVIFSRSVPIVARHYFVLTNTIPLSGYALCFIHPSRWTVVLFPFFGFSAQCGCKHSHAGFCVATCLREHCPATELLGRTVTLLNFVRTWQTFPKHLTISYSNVQIPMSVSWSMLVIVCFILAIPVGVECISWRL